MDDNTAAEPVENWTPPADRVLDAGALRALAHPLRVQIYDILSQYGPQTASTLATITGESSGSTSYHLRALAKHDLISEMEGRGSGRERWWTRPHGGVTFTNPEAMKTPSGRAATQIVMTEYLNRRHEQLMRFVNEHMQDPEHLDDEKNSMVSTATAHLTTKQTEAFIARLRQLIDEIVLRYRDQEGDDVHPVTIRADVFALPEEGIQ